MKTIEARLEDKLQTMIDICNAIEEEGIEDVEEAKYLLNNVIFDVKTKLETMAFLFANEETIELNSNDEHERTEWYKLFTKAREAKISAEVFLEMYVKDNG